MESRMFNVHALGAMLLASSSAWAESVSFYPSEGAASVLAFEDQWPEQTDYDYNDVVVQVHWTFDRDVSRPASTRGHPILRALLTIDPVALGGDHANGLGLQLPACATKAGLTVRRRSGTGGSSAQAPSYGPWEDVLLRADPSPTVVLSPNLRELFDGELGRLNVGVTGKDDRAARRLEIVFEWPVAVDLDAGQAPFDLFIFRSASPSHEIHFPTHGGTAMMNPSLFPASNRAGKWYVNDRGIPAALNLKTATVYPTEATRIDDVYPEIAAFAALSNFAEWTGTGLDPRTFYQRAGGGGGRRPRAAAPLRPARAAIEGQTCSDGLAAGRSGRRVRPGAGCVDTDPAVGVHVEDAACVPNTRSCTPGGAPANSGVQTWSGVWSACLGTSIVDLDELIVHLDASDPASYPGTGSSWVNRSRNALGGSAGNALLRNGVGFSATGPRRLLFDGADDYAGIHESGSWFHFRPNVSYNSELTIEAWIMTSDADGGAWISRPWNAAGEYSYVAGHNWVHSSTAYQQRTLYFTSIATGLWEHIAIVITPTHWGVYRNGLVDVPMTNHNITADLPSSWNAGWGDPYWPPLTIMTLYPYSWPNNGWHSIAQPSYGTAGALNTLRIYAKALTAAQIAQNYAATRGRFGP
jgi:LruC domain-containing protein